MFEILDMTQTYRGRSFYPSLQTEKISDGQNSTKFLLVIQIFWRENIRMFRSIENF